MVDDHSLSSIGRVAPAAPFALLRLPSTSTITHPEPPGVVPKFQPAAVKFAALPNCAVESPAALKLPELTPTPPNCGNAVVAQNDDTTVPLSLLKPTRLPTPVDPLPTVMAPVT